MQHRGYLRQPQTCLGHVWGIIGAMSGASSGACLGLSKISAVLHASVMPFLYWCTTCDLSSPADLISIFSSKSVCWDVCNSPMFEHLNICKKILYIDHWGGKLFLAFQQQKMQCFQILLVIMPTEDIHFHQFWTWRWLKGFPNQVWHGHVGI